jgi:hypothetical protein
VQTTHGIVEVKDAETGLTWKQANEPGRHNIDGALKRCSDLGNGYRLPTSEELLTLVDSLNAPPPIKRRGAWRTQFGPVDKNLFPDTTGSYWSSSEPTQMMFHYVAFESDRAIVYGAIGAPGLKVRCVR